MISSRQNQKLKDMRRLKRCKGEPGRAMLEGPHLVEAALDAGLELDAVLATEAFWEGPQATSVRRRMPPPDFVAPALLEELADTDSPRGLVAATRLPIRSIRDLPIQAHGLYLFLDTIQDPGNLGAIARVAEAAGATAVIAGPGCAHVTHPRALRSSAGSLLRIPTVAGASLPPLVRRLAAIQPAVVALMPRGEVDLFSPEAPLDGPVVLLVGSEGTGLDPSLFETATGAVTIPMNGPVESLNVATATGIVVYEWRRRAASRRQTK